MQVKILHMELLVRLTPPGSILLNLILISAETLKTFSDRRTATTTKIAIRKTNNKYVGMLS